MLTQTRRCCKSMIRPCRCFKRQCDPLQAAYHPRESETGGRAQVELLGGEAQGAGDEDVDRSRSSSPSRTPVAEKKSRVCAMCLLRSSQLKVLFRWRHERVGRQFEGAEALRPPWPLTKDKLRAILDPFGGPNARTELGPDWGPSLALLRYLEATVLLLGARLRDLEGKLSGGHVEAKLGYVMSC